MQVSFDVYISAGAGSEAREVGVFSLRESKHGLSTQTVPSLLAWHSY